MVGRGVIPGSGRRSLVSIWAFPAATSFRIALGSSGDSENSGTSTTGGSINRDRISLCAERDSLRRERLIAVQNFRQAIHDMVTLLQASGAQDSELDLAHLRVRAARGACEVARAALELHQAEHGC